MKLLDIVVGASPLHLNVVGASPLQDNVDQQNIFSKKMVKKSNRYRGSKSNSGFWKFLAVIVVVIAAFWGIGAMFFSVGNTNTGSNEPTVALNGACEITPTLTINAYNVESPGSSITGMFRYRKIGDTVWTDGTLGTALSGLTVGDEYEFVPGINSTVETDVPYGKMFTHKVACKVDSVSIPMYNDEIETSLSAKFYNNDGNNAAQTFTAGEELDVSIRLQAGSKEVFGNVNFDRPNILVLKLNSSEWDVPNKVTYNGATLKRVDVPLRYDSLVVSGYATYAYELPAITDTQTNIVLSLNADNTNAPSIDGTAYIYAGGYYVDSTDASVQVGVEDEEGNAVATDAPDSVTLDFTA